jgi:hypothetical protein
MFEKMAARSSFITIPAILGIIYLLTGCLTPGKRAVFEVTEEHKAGDAQDSSKIESSDEEQRAAAHEKQYPARKYLYAKMTCNIRSGPGTDYPIVGVASQGERFQIAYRVDAWYKLKVEEGEPERWMHRSVLSIDAKQPTAAPTASKSTSLLAGTAESGLPSNSDSDTPSDGDDISAANGEAIYNAIREKYPLLELSPFFSDWIEKANVVIEIPEKEWTKLSEHQSKSLELYTKSLVSQLRTQPEGYFPFKGTRTRPRWYAPGNEIWDKAYDNCRNACDDCWRISVGRISEKDSYGMKIIEEARIVAKGNS